MSKEVMSLEEYKQKVWDYLTKTSGCSTTVAEKLMKEYEDDFQEFLDNNYSPSVAGISMIHGA